MPSGAIETWADRVAAATLTENAADSAYLARLDRAGNVPDDLKAATPFGRRRTPGDSRLRSYSDADHAIY